MLCADVAFLPKIQRRPIKHTNISVVTVVRPALSCTQRSVFMLGRTRQSKQMNLIPGVSLVRDIRKWVLENLTNYSVLNLADPTPTYWKFTVNAPSNAGYGKLSATIYRDGKISIQAVMDHGVIYSFDGIWVNGSAIEKFVRVRAREYEPAERGADLEALGWIRRN